MIKKIFIISLALLLSACFGGNTIIGTTQKTHKNALFSISYPENWNNIEDLSDAPEGTLAVFRSPESVEGLFSNLSIVKDDFVGDISALEFAEINAETLPSVLQNFQSVDRENVDIAGQDTIIFTFLGRESPESRDREYSQTYLVQNGQGFVLTLIYPISLSDNEKEALKSFLYSIVFVESQV